MPIPFAQLPEDLRRYIKGGADRGDEDIPSEEILSAIGIAIGDLWEEAKTARVSSGIERRWRDAEDAYAGIDDANRGEMSGGSQAEKSMSPQGPVQFQRANLEEGDSKSTLYFLLTPRYVDAGVAKLCEILLAPGAKSFSFSATPVPELIQAKDDNRQVLLDSVPGNPPAMRPATPEEATQIGAGGTPSPLQGAAPVVPAPAVGGGPPPAPPAAGAVQISMPGQPAQSQQLAPMGHNGGPPMVPITVKDLAKEAVESAEKAAKKVEKRVYDWMVECHRSSHVRKVASDAGRLGVGVLKGPYPRPSKQMAIIRNGQDAQLKIREVIKPGSKWVNAWNFFPDPACGENIQDGEYVFEREWMTERQVRALKKLPGYIRRQINQVILEGPQKVNVKEGAENRETQSEDEKGQKGKYEVKYFYGTLTREEMGVIHDAADYARDKPSLDELAPPEREQVYAIVTMINETVVRATVNPLDSGEFPYHAMPWQRRTGSWAGKGIAEQMDTPQRVANASLRSLLDNAGVSAGGQIIIDLTKVTPADGIMAMSPHKIWYVNGDDAAVDVREAMQMFEIPNHTTELMAIFDKAMMMAEESTSIPLITQGQSGPTTPETYGGMQLQNTNAQQLLRSIGYTFDDAITVPETDQYYEWAMLDPEVPNDEKGDWTIDARGSSALIEQALQDQTVAQLLPLSVQSPAFGLNPKSTMEMYLRTKKLNPKEMQYTEEQQAKIDAAAQQTPAAPQIEAAKIRVAFEEKKLQSDDAFRQKELSDNINMRLQELKLEHETAAMKYAMDQKITLDQVKAQLAGTAMKLEAQERLSARDQAISLKRDREKQPPRGQPRRQPVRKVATPAVEPAGRAEPGSAFQA